MVLFTANAALVVVFPVMANSPVTVVSVLSFVNEVVSTQAVPFQRMVLFVAVPFAILFSQLTTPDPLVTNI